MMMIVESFFQIFALAATVIATLRGGTRVLDAITHNDDLGVMEGPLILSPFDVDKRTNTDGECYTVSPLWELTYSFSEAVRILHDSNEDDSPSDDVELSTWRSKQRVYSMSNPHKDYINQESEVPLKVVSESISSSDVSEKVEKEDERSLIVSTPDTTIILPRDLNVYQKSLNIWKYLLGKIKCFQLEGRKILPVDYSKLPRIEENPNCNIAVDDDTFVLDFDTVYSRTLSIPLSVDSKDLEPKTAQLKVFSPQTFKALRAMFGVDETSFLDSILKSGPFVSFQSNSKGAARVGGFFFFTQDGAFMVKTIKKAEIGTVLEMLPKYYTFMQQNARRSLLTRFCGLYSVKIHDNNSSGDECVFLIMNSVFPAEGSHFITERFDLKGSTVGRECAPEERKRKDYVMKDLDLAKEVNVMKRIQPSFGLSEYGLSIGSAAKSALLSQLRKDVQLLVSCSVMDYSLLVGVVNLDKFNGNKSTDADTKQEIETSMRKYRDSKKEKFGKLAELVSTPLKHLVSPGLSLGNILLSGLRSNILSQPFPYHGSGRCGVDGGTLSILPGKRLGHRAIYYIGLIDFLQPWSTQKILEKEFKGMMGYDKKAISCANPRDYAKRFLEFIDEHIT